MTAILGFYPQLSTLHFPPSTDLKPAERNWHDGKNLRPEVRGWKSEKSESEDLRPEVRG